MDKHETKYKLILALEARKKHLQSITGTSDLKEEKRLHELYLVDSLLIELV
jgi:hypothetical protein